MARQTLLQKTAIWSETSSTEIRHRIAIMDREVRTAQRIISEMRRELRARRRRRAKGEPTT